MDNKAIELIYLRNNFYRDNYRRVLLVLVFLVVANILLVVGALHIVKNPPKPVYFSATSDGRITKLAPLSAPVLSLNSLTEWAARAATAAYTFDFVNYRGSLQKSSAYFTDTGWNAFEKALVSSRNLELVLTKKLVSTAVPQGAPVVLKRGILNGAYSWQVQIPLLVSYQSASMNVQQPVLVTMLVKRVNVLNNPEGIAIAQFVSAQQATKQGRGGL